MYLISFKEAGYASADWLTLLVVAGNFKLACSKITREYPEACFFKNQTLE